jgi:hypothetical protein
VKFSPSANKLRQIVSVVSDALELTLKYYQDLDQNLKQENNGNVLIKTTSKYKALRIESAVLIGVRCCQRKSFVSNRFDQSLQCIFYVSQN